MSSTRIHPAIPMSVVPHGTRDLIPTRVEAIEVDGGHGPALLEGHVLIAEDPGSTVLVECGVLVLSGSTEGRRVCQYKWSVVVSKQAQGSSRTIGPVHPALNRQHDRSMWWRGHTLGASCGLKHREHRGSCNWRDRRSRWGSDALR